MGWDHWPLLVKAPLVSRGVVTGLSASSGPGSKSPMIPALAVDWLSASAMTSWTMLGLASAPVSPGSVCLGCQFSSQGCYLLVESECELGKLGTEDGLDAGCPVHQLYGRSDCVHDVVCMDS